MNILKRLINRGYQQVLKTAQPVLPYKTPDILDNLHQIIPTLMNNDIQSILIVTDKGLVKAGQVGALEKLLKRYDIHYYIYDEVEENPTIKNVEEAKDIYQAGECQGIIAIGGGSVLDCAKMVGAKIVHPEKDIQDMKGLLKVHKKTPLFIAIPTTAGTGSETTLSAVITDKENHYKYAINDFALIPDYAVLDPRLTVSLPPELTAATGMDALTHAIEAYIGRATTKETKELSKEAIRLIFKNLKPAFDNGEDLVARKNMLYASNYAGQAFSKSYVGYVHALSHAISGQYDYPHGYVNAIILPIMLELYGDAIKDKLYELAIVAGIAEEGENKGITAEKFIDTIYDMNAYFGIPERLEDIQIKDIPIMAEHADKEANPLYPVPVLYSKKDLEKIYLMIKNNER